MPISSFKRLSRFFIACCVALAANTIQAYFMGIDVYEKEFTSPNGLVDYKYFYFLKDAHTDYANCLFRRRQQMSFLNYLRSIKHQPTVVVAEDIFAYTGTDNKLREIINNAVFSLNTRSQKAEHEGTTGYFRSIKTVTSLSNILYEVKVLGNIATCNAEFRHILMDGYIENCVGVPHSSYIKEANEWFEKIKKAQETTPPWYPVVPQSIYKCIVSDNELMNKRFNNESTLPLTPQERSELFRLTETNIMDGIVYYYIDQHDFAAYKHNFYLFGFAHIDHKREGENNDSAGSLEKHMHQRGYRKIYSGEAVSYTAANQSDPSSYTKLFAQDNLWPLIASMEIDALDVQQEFACIKALQAEHNLNKREEIIKERKDKVNGVREQRIEKFETFIATSKKTESLENKIGIASVLASGASLGLLLTSLSGYTRHKTLASSISCTTGLLGLGLIAAAKPFARWWYGYKDDATF